ncbi:hypothetical protein SHKM778_36210 [Streptomyces sp. KM77-8]|uniref:Erythromycin esterase n=1 Tax=Streptomyces haneummycinicus TaxID=3074435 RepID=A0AAT9HIH5_9ACTN
MVDHPGIAPMADTSPARMTRLLATRDAMMAGNLLALAERGPALVSAHNSHIQRTRSALRMWDHPLLEWWSAGALVSARLGERYAFLATALGTIRHHGVDTPSPDTLEGLLYALPEDRRVVDASRLAIMLPDPDPRPPPRDPGVPVLRLRPTRPRPTAPHRRARVRPGCPPGLGSSRHGTRRE